MEIFKISNLLAIQFGFFLAMILCALVTRPSRVFGLVDRPGGRKRHARPVPITGGVAMFAAFSLCLPFLNASILPFASLIIGMGFLLAVGLLDDLEDLAVPTKLLAQVVAALLMTSWGGVQIHSLGNLFGNGPVLLGEWSIPFTVACTVLMINAINMADGFDGLAGGMSAVVIFWLGLAGWSNGAGPVFVGICFLLVSVILGFLVYNLRNPWRRRAAIFMGDSGSMMLGFAIAWLAVHLTQTPTATVYPISVAWLLVLPVIDAVSIGIRRILKGRSPFAADREHLHHLMVRAGFSVRGAVAWLIALTFLFGAIGLMGWALAWPEPILFVVVASFFLIHLMVTARAWRFIRWLRRLARPGTLPH
ncbi:MraY family glycosyltransferase [Natronospira bacteriovora]|uniref:MraY family glycosyltransferase n=1 Tax=Natronospira bacteriovora TaxID=3069753 RepID=A0ABU0W7B8_9GAMM|nr:MraY family glycosyltransferase [Natronospira sp. AB-CW4]MDQ2069904.1 MraY family glycosyltransferase [Natronospira sp. AB-CW4]